MYSLTIFKNTYDNKTHRTMQFQSWDKFALLLYELSNKEGVKGGNNSSSLISPAQFHEGGTEVIRMLINGVLGLVLIAIVLYLIIILTLNLILLFN